MFKITTYFVDFDFNYFNFIAERGDGIDCCCKLIGQFFDVPPLRVDVQKVRIRLNLIVKVTDGGFDVVGVFREMREDHRGFSTTVCVCVCVWGGCVCVGGCVCGGCVCVCGGCVCGGGLDSV